MSPGSFVPVRQVFAFERHAWRRHFEPPRSSWPEDIHLMIGHRPRAAFGNSVGDREMLEYAGAGNRVRLIMLVRHDDDAREYPYGPAHEAIKIWTVISMKNDWKRIFTFE
jgi:hypothetical protein